ncbi:MAG: helix-turn-helix domain-containing protein [Candidatus Sulfotelmatobacter sp.]
MGLGVRRSAKGSLRVPQSSATRGCCQARNTNILTIFVERQYLRVFINQLRKKIEADPSRPLFICTDPSVGYRFKPSLAH